MVKVVAQFGMDGSRYDPTGEHAWEATAFAVVSTDEELTGLRRTSSP